jgi:hypothetical protein
VDDISEGARLCFRLAEEGENGKHKVDKGARSALGLARARIS